MDAAVFVTHKMPAIKIPNEQDHVGFQQVLHVIAIFVFFLSELNESQSLSFIPYSNKIQKRDSCF